MAAKPGIPLTQKERILLCEAFGESDFTQTTLAKRIRIPQSNVSRVFSGDTNPSKTTLRALCRALDLVFVSAVKATIRRK